MGEFADDLDDEPPPDPAADPPPPDFGFCPSEPGPDPAPAPTARGVDAGAARVARGAALVAALGQWVERRTGSHPAADLAAFAGACDSAGADVESLRTLGEALLARADEKPVKWIWERGSGHDLVFWTLDVDRRLMPALDGAYRWRTAREKALRARASTPAKSTEVSALEANVSRAAAAPATLAQIPPHLRKNVRQPQAAHTGAEKP
ncbi:MAG: hypothetical protein WCJ30_02710 [Deltaproteobacteria bacterium]